MMTKDQILDRIRRLAKERDGHISLRAFCRLTHIPEKQILGKHWDKWNEALAEAGITGLAFKRARSDPDLVLEAFAHLVQRQAAWPTHNQLRRAREQDRSFPSLKVVLRLGKEASLASRLATYCAHRPDLAAAAAIAAERAQTEQAEDGPSTTAVVKGYVYLMRSGRRYKIGHTTSPTRRHREVRLDLPDPTTLLHSIPTDDPSGVEAYWHDRFHTKRVRDTEFFTLDAADVAAFKRWKSQ